MYYDTFNNFITLEDIIIDNKVLKPKSFDYGYAISVHKSQGSTIDNVFIDLNDLFKCRSRQELQQLEYVAFSRTKNNIFLLIK